jgi:RHS repeat-associated protein
LTSREEGSYNTDCKFTGKLFDNSTALYYYGARYYDPELGRFIQPDTIVPYPDDPQSFNRYAYARNNPIRYVDPTGHFWATLGIIMGIISTAAAMVSTVATVGALISGGKTEQVFSNIAMIAGITAFVTGGISMACADIAGTQVPQLTMHTIIEDGKEWTVLDPIIVSPTVIDAGGYGALGDAVKGTAAALSAAKMAATSAITSGVAAGNAVIGATLRAAGLYSNIWNIGYEMGRTAAQGYSKTFGGSYTFSTPSFNHADIYGSGLKLKADMSASTTEFFTHTSVSKTSLNINEISANFEGGITKSKLGVYGELSYQVVTGENEIKLFDLGGTRFSFHYDVGYGLGAKGGFIVDYSKGGRLGGGFYKGVGGSAELRWRNVERW